MDQRAFRLQGSKSRKCGSGHCAKIHWLWLRRCRAVQWRMAIGEEIGAQAPGSGSEAGDQNPVNRTGHLSGCIVQSENNRYRPAPRDSHRVSTLSRGVSQSPVGEFAAPADRSLLSCRRWPEDREIASLGTKVNKTPYQKPTSEGFSPVRGNAIAAYVLSFIMFLV